MLTVLATLVMAQGAPDLEIADTAGGCWSGVEYSMPAVDAVAVPVDVKPLLYISGLCARDVGIEFTVGLDAPVEHELEFTAVSSGTSVQILPADTLTPNTTYSIRVLPDFGEETLVSFTTGTSTASPAETPSAEGDLWTESWCDGREQVQYDMWGDIAAPAAGFVGWSSPTPGQPTTWQPLWAAQDRALFHNWVRSTARLDEICVSVAFIGEGGDMSEWVEYCDETTDPGTCRNGLGSLCGCQTSPGPAGVMGLALFPLLALRRRR